MKKLVVLLVLVFGFIVMTPGTTYAYYWGSDRDYLIDDQFLVDDFAIDLRDNGYWRIAFTIENVSDVDYPYGFYLYDVEGEEIIPDSNYGMNGDLSSGDKHFVISYFIDLDESKPYRLYNDETGVDEDSIQFTPTNVHGVSPLNIDYFEDFSEAFNEGYDEGYLEGDQDGYDEGYSVGYVEARDIYEDMEQEGIWSVTTGFMGMILGVVGSFMLYVFTEVEINGISLLEVILAAFSLFIGIIVIKKLVK